MWVTSGHHAAVNFANTLLLDISRIDLESMFPWKIHSPDEEYMGKDIEAAWADEPFMKGAFEKFTGKLKELEGIIDERNADKNLKNRHGAGVAPYRLLKPKSGPGVTGQGVPYSISV
ncbi:linoleate 13S-lipoxygenase 2-1 [Cucumis melo var. makuwa]|uniref:Linoleate 13S-lipoxygenase 2-1 n=1 Tax=Cucumis melo var. makuwa TaxID=1194695 RepID=A0A5D3BC39_CUCMM|nr:linoleate 13S-lipoxygenase 2-1 [Cucumis melo var. makuwa]